MKKPLTILFILIVFLSGCGLRKPDVPTDLSGWMSIRLTGYPKMNGIFTVESKEEIFTLYLMDEFNIPRGSIIVSGDRVETKDFVIDESAIELMEYWAFIFGKGEIRNPFTKDDIIISYEDYKNIGEYSFPQYVELVSVNESVRINVKYGDKSSSQD